MSSRRFLSTVLLICAFALPAHAKDETLKGKINGLRCVTDNIKCPVDENDPLIDNLADFVLQAEDGEFFYLHNVSHRIKEGLTLRPIRVTGNVDRRYRSIEVSMIEIFEDGKYKEVWTPIRREKDYRQPGSTRR